MGMKPGAKPHAFAIVDENGIEVAREIYKENATQRAREMNAKENGSKLKRHFTGI
jgi:uncharacterized protein YabE (DUF348 family)